MSVEVSIRNLEELLEQSAASPEFKEAVKRLEDGTGQELIRFNPQSPPVKVLRLVMKLLEEFPAMPLESLAIEAESGCSDYVGHAIAQPGALRFEFEWNCQWRAETMGWVDAFGDPDQIRASQTYGYQCFRRLDKI